MNYAMLGTHAFDEALLVLVRANSVHQLLALPQEIIVFPENFLDNFELCVNRRLVLCFKFFEELGVFALLYYSWVDSLKRAGYSRHIFERRHLAHCMLGHFLE